MGSGTINSPDAWKTGKTDPDTGKPVDLLRVFVDALKGEFSPSGLSKALKISNETVGTTAVKIPSVPLTDRNSLIIFNKGNETLYIGNSDVETSGAKEGFEIDAGSFFSLDIRDSIEIYGRTASGSVLIKTMELA